MYFSVGWIMKGLPECNSGIMKITFVTHRSHLLLIHHPHSSMMLEGASPMVLGGSMITLHDKVEVAGYFKQTSTLLVDSTKELNNCIYLPVLCLGDYIR